jgi:hypothetical protein
VSGESVRKCLEKVFDGHWTLFILILYPKTFIKPIISTRARASLWACPKASEPTGVTWQSPGATTTKGDFWTIYEKMSTKILLDTFWKNYTFYICSYI